MTSYYDVPLTTVNSPRDKKPHFFERDEDVKEKMEDCALELSTVNETVKKEIGDGLSTSLRDSGRTIHAVLKHGTVDLHRQLDSLPNLTALMKSTLSMVEYRQCLLAYAQTHNHIEEKLLRLQNSLSLGTLPNYIPRLPSILQDLSYLVQDPDLQRSGTGAVSVPIEAHEAGHYIGLRYVLEGATQGSKVIVRHLRKNLPQLETHAFSFWNIQLKASEDWFLFCEYMNQPAKCVEYERQLLKAARGAFQSFIECFSSFEENT